MNADLTSAPTPPVPLATVDAEAVAPSAQPEVVVPTIPSQAASEQIGELSAAVMLAQQAAMQRAEQAVTDAVNNMRLPAQS